VDGLNISYGPAVRMAQGLNSSFVGISQRAVVWVPPGTGITRLEVRQDTSIVGATHLLRLIVTVTDGTAADSRNQRSQSILSGSATGEVLLATLGNTAATQQLRSYSQRCVTLTGVAGRLTQTHKGMLGLLPVSDFCRHAGPFVNTSINAAPSVTGAGSVVSPSSSSSTFVRATRVQWLISRLLYCWSAWHQKQHETLLSATRNSPTIVLVWYAGPAVVAFPITFTSSSCAIANFIAVTCTACCCK
jgi:hypothetical protein